MSSKIYGATFSTFSNGRIAQLKVLIALEGQGILPSGPCTIAMLGMFGQLYPEAWRSSSALPSGETELEQHWGNSAVDNVIADATLCNAVGLRRERIG